MRRAALAVLFSLWVPLVLFGQRGGGGGRQLPAIERQVL